MVKLKKIQCKVCGITLRKKLLIEIERVKGTARISGQIIKAILTCVTTTRFTLLVNGSTKLIHAKRRSQTQ